MVACPNGSASLFSAAKVAHLGALPQGQPERSQRAKSTLVAQDDEGFGGCANTGERTAVCPKGIPLTVIGELNHDVLGIGRRRLERARRRFGAVPVGER